MIQASFELTALYSRCQGEASAGDATTVKRGLYPLWTLVQIIPCFRVYIPQVLVVRLFTDVTVTRKLAGLSGSRSELVGVIAYGSGCVSYYR